MSYQNSTPWVCSPISFKAKFPSYPDGHFIMSALFSYSVPFCVLLGVRPSVCSECTVYSISQSPRESGTQKTRQAETPSVWAGRGRGGRAGGAGSGRGGGGSGTGSSRGGEGSGGGDGGNNARSNKHTKSLCVFRSARTHARYLQVQLWAKKVTTEGRRGRESDSALWQRNE